MEESSFASSVKLYTNVNNYNYFEDGHSNAGSVQATSTYSQQPQLPEAKNNDKNICADK